MPTALARRFKLDVSADGTTWLPFKGMNDFNPPVNPTLVAADDYDSDGWNSFEKTMQGWIVTAKALRKTVAGVFDPGQELVRAAHDQFGDAARVYVRWYDRNGAPEAYSGLAIVGWAASKTAVADLDEVTVTLTGDGPRTAITNPGVAETAPIITSITSDPAAQIAGGQFKLTGSGFAGATGVKLGAVSVTEYLIVSDSVIVGKVPTGSAGSAAATVTNSVGTSNAQPYTRGA